MCIWPNPPASEPALRGAEGELVLVNVIIEPRRLEALLEALGTLDFPVNPQIYHRASVAYVYRDGSQRVELVTMVEFPAYSSRLGQVRAVVEALGLPAEALVHKPMLESIRSSFIGTPGPPGSPYALIARYRSQLDRQAAAGIG